MGGASRRRREPGGDGHAREPLLPCLSGRGARRMAVAAVAALAVAYVAAAAPAPLLRIQAGLCPGSGANAGAAAAEPGPRARAGRDPGRGRRHPGRAGSSGPRPDRDGGRWLLICHGNAGNLSEAGRPLHYAGLRDLGLNLLAFDYRGYGESGGRPDRAGIVPRRGGRLRLPPRRGWASRPSASCCSATRSARRWRWSWRRGCRPPGSCSTAR